MHGTSIAPLKSMTRISRLGVFTVAVATLMFTAPARQQATAQGQVTPQVYRFHGGGYDRAGGITIDAADNLYLVGSADAAREPSTFAALRFDSQGNLLWRSTYSGLAGGTRGQGFDVAVDSQGNVYACGYVGVGMSSTET